MNTTAVPKVESYHELSVAILLIAIVGFVLSASALVMFFVTKNQRRFPTCILSWIGVSNVLLCFSNVILYSGAMPSAGSDCVSLTVLGGLQTAFNTGCNTLLAAALYISVVKNIPMKYEANPVYFKSFVLSLVVWSVVFSAFTLLLTVSTKDPCKSFDTIVLIKFAPIMAALVVQFVLLGLSFSSIAALLRKVRTERSTKDYSMQLLTLRFVPTILAQLFQVLPQCIFNFGLRQDLTLSTHENILFLLVAAIIDSFVLALTSKSLRKCAHHKKSGDPEVATTLTLKQTPSSTQLIRNESLSDAGLS